MPAPHIDLGRMPSAPEKPLRASPSIASAAKADGAAWSDSVSLVGHLVDGDRELDLSTNAVDDVVHVAPLQPVEPYRTRESYRRCS
jgi:hypothetical protein